MMIDCGCRRRLWEVCSLAPIASFLFSLPSHESLGLARGVAVAIASREGLLGTRPFDLSLSLSLSLCPSSVVSVAKVCSLSEAPSSRPFLHRRYFPFLPCHRSNYNSRRWWWWDLPSFSQRPPLISLWRTTPSITTTATASSSSQQQDIAADITIGIDSSSSSISPSFGRLKAQKVKALVHRSKQHRNRSTDRPRDSSPNPRSRGGWGDVIGSFHSLNSQELAPDTSFFSVKSFRELGCADYLIQSLQKLSFLRPSNAMAFAPVIAGKTCIIADQSGSGKTLAYLAPIIRRLRQEELEGQCGLQQRTQLETLQQGVDVLIATPGRFLFLLKEGILQLTNLRWMATKKGKEKATPNPQQEKEQKEH
ncbi:DEAD-box ATP-dependent RNA helicase 50 [Arachis duranensis]|uniref:DEAD-box ATP-dependent RNA helicase 50 n=1 Tax=Arachis duranensis TaxID=130453 RepID=A0A9C6WMX4_ARADU|nr:DEAD-box ATP-dependent RNA helicase 50 [Arachis duranensis]